MNAGWGHMSAGKTGKAGKVAESAPDGAAVPKAKSGGGGVLGIAVLAVGALAASFATVYVLTPSVAPVVAACAPTETAAQIEPTLNPDAAYVEMRDLTITIGSEPATRYLKLKIAVITDSSDVSLVNKAEPVLVDAFTNYLRSVEVRDFEDPGFYAHMREQLGRRSQLVLGNGVSNGVLITEFLLR